MIGERFCEGIEEADWGEAFYAAKFLGGVAILVDAFGFGIVEGFLESGIEFWGEACALDDMTEFVDENAFDLHPAFVFEDIFFGEKDDRSTCDRGEKAALAPVVEVEFFAGFIGRKHRDIGGEFLVSEKDAEDMAIADSLGDLWLEGAHDAIKLVSGLEEGGVGNLLRSSDENILDESGFLEKGGVEFVCGDEFWGGWLDGEFLCGGAGVVGEEESEANGEENELMIEAWNSHGDWKGKRVKFWRRMGCEYFG